MALSGTVTTTKYDSTIGLTLSWTATQNASTNQSTVSWALKSTGGTTSTYWNSGPITVKINGTTVLTVTSRFKLYGAGAWSRTGSLAIAHNSDGTKSFAIQVSAAIYSTAVNCTGSGTFTLDKINLTPTAPTSVTASTPDGTVWNFGGVATIRWSGSTGVITGYEVQQWYSGTNTWTAYNKPGTTSTTCTYLNKTFKAGETYKFRVRTLNGTLASAWKESNALTFGGGINVKTDGAWRTGTIWVNINGTWTRPKQVWVKIDGQWIKTKQ